VAGGKRYYAWGTPPNPQYKWVLEDVCTRHESPGSPAFAGPDGIGVGSTPGHEEPCPEPTPEPTATPTPGDCHYTHFNLVWLCAQPSKPGCLDGKDWGRPGVVYINRDGKPICGEKQPDGTWKYHMCVRAFITANLYNGSEKIEKGHACFPEDIPEGAWGQTYPPDLRFDCGHPWGQGWNNGSCNIDFAAKNTFTLDAFGVHGETTMTARW